MTSIGIGLVGIGAIARNEHVPTIAARNDVTLVATASRNASLDGVPAYRDVGEMLDAEPGIDAVALTAPPGPRFAMAREAIARGKHIMLEKPPGATLAEVAMLREAAEAAGMTLHATWHSQHAAAVEAAREMLEGIGIASVAVTWREDVRKWHPGQEWVWDAGGFGVFDPGINALSILTHILPEAMRLRRASLEVPEGRQTPIAASCALEMTGGAPVTLDLDWRQEGPQTWDIVIETEVGTMRLSEGGARLEANGSPVEVVQQSEYASVYDMFVRLVREGASNVDTDPLVHVADAILLGERRAVVPFEW